MSEDWSQEEVEAVVADYLEMLTLEVSGRDFNKAKHNRGLQTQTGRARGSIEFKHQNISAVLRDLGHPWIEGYKPRANYQTLLFDVVAERVESAAELRRTVETEVAEPAVVPSVTDILARFESPPEREPEGTARRPVQSGQRPRFVNYLAREATNASLGRAGELFVLNFERARLISKGREQLAEKIEHISATLGDGAGFDIRSFDETGRDRLIEVKTTAYSKSTPFFVSRNEVVVSQHHQREYHLYRVFKFRRDPRLFAISGALDHVCELEAVQFSARVA